ncbi:DsbA family oxidoreductase [Subtercola boreus]|uniref:Disulfide bond formation protein DsbA n=1 Tax=Subtercola boreus TaxID=120213 RepID=A0A3E0WCB2_9MICO|nr:DsbA family oxidoreductase [Subtercola boreus]RFA20811.1 disulfide bond formation protein DsbA [Subtercola boreus]RFA20926.1 disulfide bond formation protein DsbA [Subtercola boreus]RFA27119.1 disulfide bond formation protein DsbA [Subtercola boreus]
MSESVQVEGGPITIDVWSDIACPWCYIGKRKLESGIAAYRAGAGDHPLDIEVEYHSFELAPDTPVDFDGTEIDFLAKHKGLAPEQTMAMLDRVTGIAREVGLHYDYDALQHTNTVKAHQLIHYAKAHGVQLEAKERLLKAYFEEGRHVGRDDDLADLAAEIGLDRDDVLRSLGANEYLPAVKADQAQAVEYGIQGVPFFVFDAKYGVSGAQDAAVFSQLLGQLADERSAVAP